MFKNKRTQKKSRPQAKEVTLSAPLAPWRRLLRPRVLVLAILAVLLLIAGFVGFKIYTAIAQDLVLVLTPAEASLTLEQGATANLTFAATTSPFFLCRASCEAELRDLARELTIERRIFDGNGTFSFEAPQRGEGQALYGVTVRCKNAEQFLCAHGGVEHAASALVTLDYAPSPAKRAQQADATAALATFLQELQELDENSELLTRNVQALQRGQGLPLDGLENDARTLGVLRDLSLVAAPLLRERYVKEEYAALVAQIPGETGLALNRSRQARRDLEEYALVQQQLVRDLREEIALARTLDDAYRAFLSVDASDGAQATKAVSKDLARLARRVATDPSASARSRSLELANISAARESALRAALIVLEDEATAIDALLVTERARLDATNATVQNGSESTATNATNSTVPDAAAPYATSASLGSTSAVHAPSSITNISFDETSAKDGLLCAQLASLVQELANKSISATNTTQLLLTRCAKRNDTSIAIVDASLSSLRFETITLNMTITGSDVDTTLHLAPPQCCAFGTCKTCCDAPGCTPQTPILFLHGHSMSARNAPEYSLEAFSAHQEKLEEEGAIVNAGSLTPYSAYVPIPRGAWGRTGVRFGASGTYYYDAYLSGGSYILSSAKSESIDTYAIRLRDIVETLRARTGSERVVIVAHSMGGLVARRYLQLFGETDVERLILVATPNFGTNSTVATICPFFGADKECTELTAGSSMLAKLNDPSRQPTIPVSVIVGTGCAMGEADGDGVVTAASATLPEAELILVNGTCTSLETLHTAMLDPTRYPQVYDAIKARIMKS